MTTYYVNSATGSDTNAGTSATAALQSIAAVEKLKLQPGDSVLFARDTAYTGDQLTIKYSGTADNPITIGAYGSGAAPVFSGAGTGISAISTQNVVIKDLTVSDTSSNAIFAHGATNLTIQNVQVIDTGTPAHSGAISLENSTNVTVEDSTITGVTGDGIWVNGGSGIVLQHNNIGTVQGTTGDNIQVTGATNVSVLDNSLDMSGQTNSTKGNLVVNTSEGVTIEGNTLVGGGYGASVNSNDVTIAHNEVYGQSGYTWSFGIGIGETWPVSNYDIYDNDVHDVLYGVAITGTTSATRTNIDVHDNTFDNISGAALKVDRPASGDFSDNEISANSAPTRISGDVSAAGTFTVGQNGTFITFAPHAMPDTAVAVAHDNELQGNLTANDTSPTGRALTITEFGGEAVSSGFGIDGKYGHVSVDQNGNFVYTVDAAAVDGSTKELSDVFKYLVSDGRHESVATLTVDILPRLEVAPVATNDGVTVNSAGAATGNVLANDHDANGDTLYVRSADTTKVTGSSAVHVAGAYGTLTIAADGTYSYQVDPTKVGSGQSVLNDTFSYKISDSSLQDTGSLTVHIDPQHLATATAAEFHM
ncbi:MAG TPA: Ig-like domain-containing protein [Devosiaceae bacterium]|nr:Ig-like domain-containing protein [Devosiaceae bacterium]